MGNIKDDKTCQSTSKIKYSTTTTISKYQDKVVPCCIYDSYSTSSECPEKLFPTVCRICFAPIDGRYHRILVCISILQYIGARLLCFVISAFCIPLLVQFLSAH